jgi:hypothetical protein
MKGHKMKKLAIAVSLAISATSANAFLENWQFNPDGSGVGGATTINEFTDIVGISYVRAYSDPARTTLLSGSDPAGTPYFFTQNSAFRIDTHDFGAPLGGTRFITALYDGGIGSGTLGGGVTFSAGGVLNFYSDAANNFATSAGIYGANDGTPIGTFTQIAGCQACFVDPSGLPTGSFAIFFEASSLASGYWFDSLGNELQAGTVLGFATTNASFVRSVPAIVVSEIVDQQSGALGDYTNSPSRDFVLSNNGQFRLDAAAIPEPSVPALLGLGLIGLGFMTRRKQVDDIYMRMA